MNLTFTLSQWLKRPTTLWLCFALVVSIAVGGLAVLSKHALRLSRRDQESKQRETVQTNLRVALWRLDSRLAPYVATIHDLPRAQSGVQERFQPAAGFEPDFVRDHFSIVQAQGKASTARAYYSFDVIRGGRVLNSANQNIDPHAELRQAVPVDALLASVERSNQQTSLFADQPAQQVAVPSVYDSNLGQQLVPGYANFKQEVDGISQRELDNRSFSVQRQVASNSMQMQQQEMIGLPQVAAIVDSMPTRLIPVWIDDELVVVRDGMRGSAKTLEGVWIDWPKLEASLLADIDDLAPGADLVAVQPDQEVDPSRILAALPVMIEPAELSPEVATWSATHNSLVLSWLALIAATIVAGLALSRIIALSERRASFVSAVTHELRTPLTTFRLYSDLLARGMVSDEKDRNEYLQTLRREADRLTHLVDNVLRYSKLERQSKRPELETVVVSQWIERIVPRLTSRLSAVEMDLVVDQTGDGPWQTDPAAMEQVVFNLIDNAAKYASDTSDKRVHLDVSIDESRVKMVVTDHGPGVEKTLQTDIFKPFSKSAQRAAETAAGVGLGLALARQTAAAHGGRLTYQPAQGGGAAFTLDVPR